MEKLKAIYMVPFAIVYGIGYFLKEITKHYVGALVNFVLRRDA